MSSGSGASPHADGRAAEASPRVRWRAAARRALAALRTRLTVRPHEEVGRGALFVLLAVVPFFNPPLVTVGQERLYLGSALVGLAAFAALPAALARRPAWVVVAFVLALDYVLAVALLRGISDLGVLANVYRPLQASIVFVACVILIGPVRASRWLHVFLVGGLAGCGLALLNAAIPGVDLFPFSSAGPDYPFDAPREALGGTRESGAFVYPTNLGTYAAYVASVGAVALALPQTSRVARRIAGACVVAGLLTIYVASARSAGIGLLIALAAIAFRHATVRRTLAIALVGTVAAFVVSASLGAGFEKLVETRVGTADESFDLRLETWRVVWRGFTEYPVLGVGLVPGTIDSTALYLLYVGGVVGAAIIAGFVAVTLLRPLWLGDARAVPVLLVAATSSLLQDTLGQMLSSWALGAAVYLLSPVALDGHVALRRSIRAGTSRPPTGARRRPAFAGAVAIALVSAVVFAVAGARGWLSSVSTFEAARISPTGARAVALAPTASGSAAAVLTRGFGASGIVADVYARRGGGRLWVADARRSPTRLIAVELGRPEGRRLVVTTRKFVGAMPRGSWLVAARERAGATALTLLAAGDARHAAILTVVVRGRSARTVATKLIRVPVTAGALKAVAIGRWSGPQDDLVLVHGSDRRRLLILSGESGFTRPIARILLVPRALEGAWFFAVEQLRGRSADLVVVNRDGLGARLVVYSGESRFRRVTADQRLASDGILFAAGAYDGVPTLYVVRPRDGVLAVDAYPLTVDCDRAGSACAAGSTTGGAGRARSAGDSSDASPAGATARSGTSPGVPT